MDQMFRGRVGIEDEKGNLLFITSRFRAFELIWQTARFSLGGARRSRSRSGAKPC